jgi:acylphosphatase
MSESPVRRRVRASGRVQGVFFRDSTRQEAERRGVAGWVRNCADGSVEAVFEGSPDAVEGMVEFTRSGPGSASVSELDVSQEEPEGLSGFDVR